MNAAGSSTRRLVIAPNAFKETLTAAEAAEAIRAGAARADSALEFELVPIADGGDGTLDALTATRGGERRSSRVTGPLGDPVDAEWALLGGGRVAVIEMARAAGLALTPRDQRDPEWTTTFGVGELIIAAREAGARRIIVGVGGSATCDGGCGCAQALGVRFVLTGGETLDASTRPVTGGDLELIEIIEAPRHANALTIEVACDVRNPLFGPDGAAFVFGPQKGASPDQIVRLDEGLQWLAELVGDAADPDEPGAGAAGGLGFGLSAWFNAALRPGIDLVLDAVRFDERAEGATLILTGEGRLDGQSVEGKAIGGVAWRGLALGVPTVALVGSTGPDAKRSLRRHGGPLEAFYSVTDTLGWSESRAMASPAEALEALAELVVREKFDAAQS
ncbi:MAG: glycerate kinase [Phycisphaerales bacterium]